MLLVAAYCMVHTLTRLTASGNLGENDALDAVLAQTLQWGYSVEHGPLYDWLLWAVQQAIGPTLSSFLLIKYSLLTVLAGLLFALTRRLTGSGLWAFIAVESMASVYQIFWRLHEGFTHRVGAMVLCVATLFALVQLVEKPGHVRRATLAFLIGLGLLSEHSYLLSLAALALAAARQPAARRVLFHPATLAWLPLPLLMALPYASWLFGQADHLATLRDFLLAETVPHTPAGIAGGLRDALLFPIFVLAPYVLVVPMVFPSVLTRVFGKPAPAAASFSLKQLIRDQLLLQWAALLLLNGILLPRVGYAVHSILPLFVITLVWLTGKIQETCPTPARVRAFILVLLVFTVAAYTVRAGNLFVHEPFCSRCRWAVPYDDLAETVRQRGFTEGTLVAGNDHIGGNLRRAFPRAHVVLGGPDTPPPADGRPMAIVWPLPEAAPGDTAPAEQVTLPWHHLWRPPGQRHSTWGVRVHPARPATP